MSLRKRIVSNVIQSAAARAAGLETIDPLPVFGTELTLQGFKTLIASGLSELAAYNTLLTEAGEAKNRVERCELQIRDYSERFLAAVAGKYGKDSDEYEMAGGTKKSERKRRTSAAGTPVPLSTAA